MSRELVFDGWWEGEAVYTCDCCHCTQKYRFDSEDIDSKAHRSDLRSKGWQMVKVNNVWRDFCSEACRNKYIRNQTI